MTTIIIIALSLYSVSSTLFIIHLVKNAKSKVNSNNEHLRKLAQWSTGDAITRGRYTLIYHGYANIDNNIRVKLSHNDDILWYSTSELFNNPIKETENISLNERLLIQ